MTQKKVKIKKGDNVIVIAGKDKGKKGEVLSVIRETDRVIVAGVNILKKHKRADKDGAAAIIRREAGLHISNVSLIDPKEGKATRVGYKVLADGSKVRVARRSGETIS